VRCDLYLDALVALVDRAPLVDDVAARRRVYDVTDDEVRPLKLFREDRSRQNPDLCTGREA